MASRQLHGGEDGLGQFGTNTLLHGTIREFEGLASGDPPTSTCLHGAQLGLSAIHGGHGNIQEAEHESESNMLSNLPLPDTPSTTPQQSQEIDWSGLITWGRNNLDGCNDPPSRQPQRTPNTVNSKGCLRAGLSRSNCCMPVATNKPMVCLSELATVLSCTSCGALPITTATVHSCLSGHQFCANCYTAEHTVCKTCSEPLDCRNELLETVLQRLRMVCPELFPQEDILVRLNSDLQQKLELAEESAKAVQHSSHKPVTCPNVYCHRVVASNGFLAHFEFEHPSVPIFQMSPGLTHEFGLPPLSLKNSNPSAVAVIEVIITNSIGCVVAKKRSTLCPRAPAFPVRRDAIICVLLSATVQYGDSYFLAAWCSCLYEDLPPFTYSLHARTFHGAEISYNGPMTSLHHSQNLGHILRDAQCLVLAPGCFALHSDIWPVDLSFHAVKL